MENVINLSKNLKVTVKLSIAKHTMILVVHHVNADFTSHEKEHVIKFNKAVLDIKKAFVLTVILLSNFKELHV